MAMRATRNGSPLATGRAYAVALPRGLPQAIRGAERFRLRDFWLVV